jgi:hypothetical protein
MQWIHLTSETAKALERARFEKALATHLLGSNLGAISNI